MQKIALQSMYEHQQYLLNFYQDRVVVRTSSVAHWVGHQGLQKKPSDEYPQHCKDYSVGDERKKKELMTLQIVKKPKMENGLGFISPFEGEETNKNEEQFTGKIVIKRTYRLGIHR